VVSLAEIELSTCLTWSVAFAELISGTTFCAAKLFLGSLSATSWLVSMVSGWW